MYNNVLDIWIFPLGDGLLDISDGRSRSLHGPQSPVSWASNRNLHTSFGKRIDAFFLIFYGLHCIQVKMIWLCLLCVCTNKNSTYLEVALIGSKATSQAGDWPRIFQSWEICATIWAITPLFYFFIYSVIFNGGVKQNNIYLMFFTNG